MEPPGWYYAQGDPPDTQRYWDGRHWHGDPIPSPAATQTPPPPPPPGQVAQPAGQPAQPGQVGQPSQPSQPWGGQAAVPAYGAPVDYRRYAAPWPRIGARFIDNLLTSVLAGPLAFLLFRDDLRRFVDEVTAGNSTVDAGFAAKVGLLSVAMGFLVEAVPTAIKGASLGKLMIGLRVVTTEDECPIGWSRSILRWGLISAFTVVPVVGGLLSILAVVLSLVWLFSDPQRRSAYDRVAGTFVVRAEDQTPGPPPMYPAN